MQLAEIKWTSANFLVRLHHGENVYQHATESTPKDALDRTTTRIIKTGHGHFGKLYQPSVYWVQDYTAPAGV